MKFYYKLNEQGNIIGKFSVKPVNEDSLLFVEEPIFNNVKWNGDKWIIDDNKQLEFDANRSKQELINIDLASIRSIREYLSTLETCPKQLKDHEKAAKEKRKKITDFNKKQKK
jgi:hypothetical protein